MKTLMYIGMLMLISSFTVRPLITKTSNDYRQAALSPEGSWTLIPALASDTATGKIPTLTFSMKNNRVSGNTGCNNFSGTFTINKNALSFHNDFVSTKMACEGYDEQAFVANLLRTNNFTIHGDTLCLQVDQTPLSYWLKKKTHITGGKA